MTVPHRRAVVPLTTDNRESCFPVWLNYTKIIGGTAAPNFLVGSQPPEPRLFDGVTWRRAAVPAR